LRSSSSQVLVNTPANETAAPEQPAIMTPPPAPPESSDVGLVANAPLPSRAISIPTQQPALAVDSLFASGTQLQTTPEPPAAPATAPVQWAPAPSQWTGLSAGPSGPQVGGRYGQPAWMTGRPAMSATRAQSTSRTGTAAPIRRYARPSYATPAGQ
jgi:hypothetical protein